MLMTCGRTSKRWYNPHTIEGAEMVKKYYIYNYTEQILRAPKWSLVEHH